MKKLLSLLVILQFYCIDATWVIASLENKSDLILDQAVRSSNASGDVAIQSISKKIKNAEQSDKIILTDDGFGTVGKCKILAHTPSGERVTILFLADPTNRIANGRTKDADIHTRLLAHTRNQGMMARVMIEQDGKKKMIGSYCGYEQENQGFQLLLKGSEGNYKADLIPVN